MKNIAKHAFMPHSSFVGQYLYSSSAFSHLHNMNYDDICAGPIPVVVTVVSGSATRKPRLT